jgi:hypothetical protein
MDGKSLDESISLLEIGYCSMTLSNHYIIRLVTFVSKIKVRIMERNEYIYQYAYRIGISTFAASENSQRLLLLKIHLSRKPETNRCKLLSWSRKLSCELSYFLFYAALEILMSK